MEIVKYPTQSLLEKSVEVTDIPAIKEFALELFKFMHTELRWGKPVGLAAPQVGRNIRLFWALDECYINPVILWKPEGGKIPYKEGCYSLEENKAYPVERAYGVKLQYYDLDGKSQEKRFNGFPAQVIQHEYDHIEGLLCCGN